MSKLVSCFNQVKGDFFQVTFADQKYWNEHANRGKTGIFDNWGRKLGAPPLGRIYMSVDKNYFALLSVVYKLHTCKRAQRQWKARTGRNWKVWSKQGLFHRGPVSLPAPENNQKGDQKWACFTLPTYHLSSYKSSSVLHDLIILTCVGARASCLVSLLQTLLPPTCCWQFPLLRALLWLSHSPQKL